MRRLLRLAQPHLVPHPPHLLRELADVIRQHLQIAKLAPDRHTLAPERVLQRRHIRVRVCVDGRTGGRVGSDAPFRERVFQVVGAVVAVRAARVRMQASRRVHPRRPQQRRFGLREVRGGGVDNVSQQRNHEVPSRGITRDDDFGGGVAAVEQPLVRGEGVLESGGETAARVGGEAVLQAEDVRVCVFREEAGAEGEVLDAAVAVDKGAAVEMEDYSASLLVAGATGDVGVPCPSYFCGLDVLVFEHSFVDVFRAWFYAFEAVTFGAGSEGQCRMTVDEGGVVDHYFGDMDHDVLFECVGRVQAGGAEDGGEEP